MTSFPTSPRVAPLSEAEMDDEQRALMKKMATGRTVNIYATVARNAFLGDRMTSLGQALRSEPMSLRHREIVILRTGWRCQSVYEFSQHRALATDGGMTTDDLKRIVAGPDAAGWDPFEATLCRAADEMHDHACISEATWQALTERYGDKELIQLTMLCGYYRLVSGLLNTFGVPLEAHAQGWEGLL
ncbi:MAG: carboxymuconolactone decarboxylase family protein [Acidimicrobiia bacterium]